VKSKEDAFFTAFNSSMQKVMKEMKDLKEKATSEKAKERTD
jgi:hypothetical protein